MGRFRGLKSCTYFIGAILVLLQPACRIPFLSKNDDAQLEAVHTASKVSAALEKQTNLTRFSGRAFFVKLSALFPDAPDDRGSFNENTFALEFSAGANQAIAQLQRPVNALQQVAVKNNVTKLCRITTVPAHYSGQKPGSIYSDQVWMTGETKPDDPATLAAMTVSRNAWLEPLPADAPEILELAKLYTSVLANRDGVDYPGGRPSVAHDRILAHRALCTATLLSAQFSMGIPGPRDAMRRMMVEIGNRVPTFAELESITLGKKTLVQFLTELQANPESGYYTSVHQWHRDWLGLRSFLPNSIWANTYPDDRSTFDPRGGGPYSNRKVADFSYIGAILYDAVRVTGASLPVINLPHEGQSVPGTCISTLQQDFDPRTTMILFEAKIGSGYQIQGGFVAKERIQDYQNALGASNFNVATDCVLMSATGSKDIRFSGLNSAPDYYRCRGRINGSPSEMQDLVRTNSRTRRFSPSGEQNGVSVVKTWYTGESRLVCNSIQRFEVSCALRPHSTTRGLSTGSDYFDPGVPGQGIIQLGTYWNSTPLYHPGILNQFRCGKPNATALAASQLNDTQAYPYGYDQANYYTSSPSNLNDVMTLAQARTEIDGEALAIRRLRRDLREEPYNLLDHVLKNNLSYKEVFSANYLVGHSELELFYRAQGQHLPLYPPGYQLNPGENRDPATASSTIPLSSFQGIPSSYFSNTMGLYGGSSLYQYYRSKPAGLVPPRPAAGMLAMPAFVSPVGGKMRTIASRYFTRLLCGEPSVFIPTAAQKALHTPYMLDVNNPATNRTAAKHLDQKAACFGCHVNLDPLGAALSSTFLANVQVNESVATTGDMAYMGVWQGGSWLGAVYKPSRGRGAFLGAEVTGLEGVAQQLVTSPIWSKCVVDKTFESVFGRVRTLADTDAFNSYHKKFSQHFNYNQLVKDMVGSNLYQGAN